MELKEAASLNEAGCEANKINNLMAVRLIILSP